MKILRTNVDISWRIEKSITGENGGNVWVGDYTRGISDVTILPGRMFDNINVNFNWKTKGLLIGKIDISPCEVLKIDPIRIRLSYLDADLSDIDESQIKLYGFNDRNCSWELAKSFLKISQKRVVGFLNQSSYYALAVSE